MSPLSPLLDEALVARIREGLASTATHGWGQAALTLTRAALARPRRARWRRALADTLVALGNLLAGSSPRGDAGHAAPEPSVGYGAPSRRAIIVSEAFQPRVPTHAPPSPAPRERVDTAWAAWM